MAAKRKTLPKDFEEILGSASLEELQAVFDKTLLDARGGYAKATAIGFPECPDALIVWLVEQGADVDAPDLWGASPLMRRASLGKSEQIPLLLSLGAGIERRNNYGCTPLHAAAARGSFEVVRVLLDHGADLGALEARGATPLLYGLMHTQNIHIASMARSAAVFVDAGAEVSEEMREEVKRIGTDFEFHRAGFNPDFLAETEVGLAELYRLFGVETVPIRRMHTGSEPIVVTPGRWQDQHAQLWELLVPSNGAAATVQGEVIRVSGRIAREILDNGSPNWDRDFRAMLASLPEHFVSGTPLPPDELTEANTLAHALRSGDGEEEQVYRLSELAVAWVILNPAPMPLPKVGYAR